MIWRILHWACRLFLGGIFIYAGYTKMENPLQFAAAVEAYQLLPPHLVIWVVKILPWFEIVLGAVLAVGFAIRYTAAVAGGFLAFFVGVMFVTYLRGIEADCGCFGVGERISPFTLARDALFILPALFLIIQPRLERRSNSKSRIIER
jgi:putative oxidoreductase